MDKFVLTDSIVVNTRPCAYDEPAAFGGLPRQANTRCECGQRNPVLAGEVTIKHTNAVRRRWIMVLEVFRHNISLKCSSRGGLSGWDLRIRRHGAGPQVREVSIFIAERAVVFPAYAQVQRQAFTHLPIILIERIHVGHTVTVNDSVWSASHTEETKKDVPDRAAGGVSRVICRTSRVNRSAASPTDDKICERSEKQKTSS